MKHIGLKNVSINSGFFHEKQNLNKDITINAVYDRFYETGRIEAFRCDWKEGMDKKPHFFWDSDVAKWIEGAAYILQKEDNQELEDKVENIIDNIEKNQGEDGYFNIYFTVCEPEKRFTQRPMHELYCAGHLIEAAVAYYECTGKDRFLKLMEKYADYNYIYKVFVDEKSAKFVTPGHEEIELALIRLWRVTGNRKYLDLSAFFINNRGVWDEGVSTNIDNQSHAPVREQTEAVGHCVRACYLYSAMADLAYETNDEELYKVCKTIFDDIVRGKMYITGGIGSSRKEDFCVPYDLRNSTAYTETCAAISLMFFAHRMEMFENKSEYAEITERILYNAMISGLSLDGKAFFYENPLEINLSDRKRNGEIYAITTRVEVFGCSCCPPNLNRVLSSLGDYIYGYENGTIYVNQFAGSEAKIGEMSISQITDFPKSDEITFIAENVKKLCIRIPSWCRNFSVSADYREENGYAVIENPEGAIKVKLPMVPFLIQSNSNVSENCGKVAVVCGPYICAAESVDNIENLHSIFIDKNFIADFEYSDEMDGFKVNVKSFRKITDENLYSKYDEVFEDFTLRMIPYASFANRGESNMCVWFNIR